ncbi:cytochrome P450 [Alcanivorax sp. 1008]|uniref:cytochrome P450 n=1 Tax=Alcanivorax sp. 1008 TaxID=2816853 RepID=UPI001DCBBC20|nr:cytochrome P450 [Alcanivorax sp. 1008]MCC1498315.1 cytochrome P450 [Alcanivorax sp. 1008]
MLDTTESAEDGGSLISAGDAAVSLGKSRRRSRPAFRIPKGTLLVAHIGYFHQRDDHFESLQAFQPERFLGKRPETNYYAPFGGGLHSCIGNHFAAQEVRVFLKVMFGKGGNSAASVGRSWRSGRRF